MKAYKCDMCGRYVDDAFSIKDICKPNFKYYEFNKDDRYFHFCKECFRNVMHYIYDVRKNHGLESK